jgi:rod shape-determining protein MreD
MIDGLKIGVIVFVAAVLQASVFASASIIGGAPDILLVALVAVALVRGATTGAVAGFFGGLVIDIALLDTLGVTSLLLTLVGYWTGRYGETTPSRRRYAPYLAVGVMTVLFLVGMLALRFMLAEPAPAREVLFEPPAHVAGLRRRAEAAAAPPGSHLRTGGERSWLAPASGCRASSRPTRRSRSRTC